MQATIATALRSARRSRRCPLPHLLSLAWGRDGHQPPSAGGRGSSPAAAAAAAAAASPSSESFSSSTSSTGSRTTDDAVPGGGSGGGGDVGDVTEIFGDPSFWEGEYSSQYASQEKHKAFEWFLPYDGGLRDHLVVFLGSMPSCDRLLHVGCGTSEVGPKLAQEPDLSLHVTDADNSPSAVRIMKQRHAALDNYACREADVLNLDFPDGSFDAVVDKGTLDALLCRSVEDAREMVTEMHRVLSDGGIYVQVTTEDPDARLELLLESSSSSSSSKRKEKRVPQQQQERQQRQQQNQQPWSRSLFKELGALGEGGESSYFMYVLVK